MYCVGSFRQLARRSERREFALRKISCFPAVDKCARVVMINENRVFFLQHVLFRWDMTIVNVEADVNCSVSRWRSVEEL